MLQLFDELTGSDNIQNNLLEESGLNKTFMLMNARTIPYYFIGRAHMHTNTCKVLYIRTLLFFYCNLQRNRGSGPLSQPAQYWRTHPSGSRSGSIVRTWAIWHKQVQGSMGWSATQVRHLQIFGQGNCYLLVLFLGKCCMMYCLI